MGKYIDDLVNELEEMKFEGMFKETETARFTVVLKIEQMRRLEYFCEYFGVKRASFAADLIMGAIAEIEDKFNLTYQDYQHHIENNTELTKIQEEYFSDVLRIGQMDFHTIKDGVLTITDKNGKIIKSDFTEEEGENHE